MELLLFTDRQSDSAYIETVSHGYSMSDGALTRPAESRWHLIIVRQNGRVTPLMVGPLRASGVATFTAEAEFLWIKFRLGVFMPHLPLKDFLDLETPLPGAGSQSFWLKGCAWPFPSAENVETFVQRMAREEVLVRDPVVEAVINDQPQPMSSRTLRERFLRSTGLSQVHIRQHQRAHEAADLLAHGTGILDVVAQLGYFDQSHLTHSLKRFVGRTPAQILGPLCQPSTNPAGSA